MKKITVSEQTLKSLMQNTSSPLLFREKTAIAECIDGYGADIVELGEIKKLREDTIIYKTVSSVIKNAAVCIAAGDSPESIAASWECIKNAEKPVLQIEMPVSAVTMEYKYHAKEDKAAAIIDGLCRTAASYCREVEFSALDATRADPSFLKRAIETAVNAGATYVTLCDDEGGSLDTETGKLVAAVAEYCNVPIFVKVSNRLGMATACAAAAIKAGAVGVKTAVSGKDILNTASFAELAQCCGEKIGFTTSLKLTEIKTDVKKLIKKADRPFAEIEHGGEPQGPDIFLDISSTLPQVSAAAKQLGYTLSSFDDGEVFREVQHVCAKKGAVGDRELEAIIASSAMQAPAVYHLRNYNTTSGNLSGAMAGVTLVKNGSELIGTAVGDGPIDAAFKAIEQCIGFHYELDAFRIQAVTEGKEALGATLVRLRNGGKVYPGNGLSTDIVGASIRAYINALNKIAAEEENS